jgi:hypothetical protein
MLRRLSAAAACQTIDPTSSGCINAVIRRGNAFRSSFLSSTAEPRFSTVSWAFRSNRAPILPMSLS